MKWDEKIAKNLEHMVNRTVESVETINAEFGRTYHTYTCIKFTDGEKIMLSGGVPFSPGPSVEEMRKASNFFTSQEITARFDELEQQRRRREESRKADKRRELERLKKELGE